MGLPPLCSEKSAFLQKHSHSLKLRNIKQEWFVRFLDEVKARPREVSVLTRIIVKHF